MGKSSKGAGLGIDNNRRIIDSQHRLDIALKYHMSGILQKAKALYLKILKTDPGNADAFHILSLLMHQRDDHEAAIRPLGVRPLDEIYQATSG